MTDLPTPLPTPPAFNPAETYTLQPGGSLIRGSDQALIPPDPANRDYRAYLAWVAAGNTATPYVAPPAAPPTCQLWQLQSVMTTNQWTQVQAAVAALANPAITAFFQHGTNVIPANSTTLVALGAQIGLTADQVTTLVQQASQVSIP